MMTLLYTGGLPSETPAPTCLQPVINSLEATIVGLADSTHAYVSVTWTADNATGFALTIDGVAAEFTGQSALFSLEFGQSYQFVLRAMCGELSDEQTLDYEVAPCGGQPQPTITSFAVSQSIATGAVTFDWETVDSYGGIEISNNGAIVVTGNTLNGSDTIPQPQELGQQSFTLKAKGSSSLCFSEDTQSLFLDSAIDLTFYRLGQWSPSTGGYHILYYDYFKGVTVADINLTSQGPSVELIVQDDHGQTIDLTDINIAPLGQNYSNPFTLYFSSLNFTPSTVVSTFEVGKINNQLAAKFLFVSGTAGQTAVAASYNATKGDIFMTLNEDAGLSPTNPTSSATISSATGLIPANGQHGDYGSQQILPLFTPNSNGDIWMSFQIKTHITYHTPNHATVALFSYNPTNSEDYGTKVGSSVTMTGLKYRQFSNNTITVIGGYVNKAALTNQAPGSPYYVTVDSVGWY